MPEQEPRPIVYADRVDLERAIAEKYPKAVPAPVFDDDFDDEDETPPVRKPPIRSRGFPKTEAKRLPGGEAHEG